MKKRLLVICYNFYPLNTPHSTKWAEILKIWHEKYGVEIDIVTSWKPGLHKEENYLGLNIYRVNNMFTEKIRHRGEVTNKGNSNIENKKKVFNQIIKRSLKFIHDNTWKKLYWPDFACLWYFHALSKSRELMKKNHYNSLLSISFPFTPHLVAYKIKKENPVINWKVEVGDPFYHAGNTAFNNEKIYKHQNYLIEKKVFEYADQIFAYREIIDVYRSEHPSIKQKFIEIPVMLFESSNSNKKSFYNNKDINIAFIGTMYRKVRNPEYMFKIFDYLFTEKKIRNVRLHFIGNSSDCDDIVRFYKNKLQDNFIVHGVVSKDDAICAAFDSDILINIGNDSLYQAPSKLIEYISTGNTIIDLLKIENEQYTNFLKKYRKYYYIEEKTPYIEAAEKILTIIEKDTKQVSAEELNLILESHRVDNIEKIYKI